jgi:hypothetical protein
MAWIPYNSSMRNYPLFGEAGQGTEDLNYNHQLFGHPPAPFLENTPPFFTEDSLCDSLVQCPQPDRRVQMGPGGTEFHPLNSSTTSHPSIKFNDPSISVADAVTKPSAVWPHSLPSTPSTDRTRQISHHSQMVKRKPPQPSNRREKSK